MIPIDPQAVINVLQQEIGRLVGVVAVRDIQLRAMQDALDEAVTPNRPPD